MWKLLYFLFLELYPQLLSLFLPKFTLSLWPFLLGFSMCLHSYKWRSLQINGNNYAKEVKNIWKSICRWISSIDDLSMIVYAKICILIHSLLNVYENAMVFICLIWFLNVKLWVADFGWKNTISDKRSMGFVFWRGGNIRRAE